MATAGYSRGMRSKAELLQAMEELNQERLGECCICTRWVQLGQWERARRSAIEVAMIEQELEALQDELMLVLRSQ